MQKPGNNMRSYIYNIVLLVSRLLLAVVLFFIGRLFFYIYNFGLFADIEFWHLAKIFFIGIRFDLSVICYFNLLFIIVHLIPLGRVFALRPIQLFLKLYFVIINGILLFSNLIDSVYFHFVQKRSTADIFKFIFLSDDVPTLLPGFVKDYWFVGIIWLIIILLTWIIYPKFSQWRFDKSVMADKKVSNSKLWLLRKKKGMLLVYKLFMMLVLIGVTLIGARGGLQLKPLSIIDASRHVSVSQMPLVLNSVFTIMTTFGHDELIEKKYFTEKQCEEIYPIVHNFKNDNNDLNKKNIVVLLLESFSKEYVGSLNNYKGYTPFLDSLMQHSLVMENAFANGLRSIDAIPAIVIGVPSLMDDPFITSVYNTNSTNSIPVMLKEQGYYTAFFHGGTNGTMNFDGFAGYAGFDDYYGRFEYNNDDDYDGFWGIYDEPFLQYFAQKLNSFNQPFFAFDFTLSSHYPYNIPENHKDEFPEGTMRIHKVVRYTDFALMKFFNTAKNMPWYNNTLFIIVADHPAQSVIPSNKNDIEEIGQVLSSDLMSYYKNTSGRYAIPMMFYSPGDSLFIGVHSGTIQQTDIFSTILDYLNYSEPVIAFGTSILNDSSQRVAVQYVNGFYQITADKYSLLFDGEISISLYNNEEDPQHKQNLIQTETIIADSLETTVKSILQQYLTRMINNDLQIKK